MTSETVRHSVNVIPYRMVLPEDFVCPDPDSRTEGMLQAQTIAEADHILRSRFRDRIDAFIDSGGFVFYQAGDMSARVRPDLYIAFGVDEAAIRRRNGYVVWEVGKPPDFVLEVASETTNSVDTGTKSGIYSGMGAAEYWRFDSTGGEYYGYALAGDILVNGVYQPIPLTTGPRGEVCGYSPALDLSLCALSQEGGSRLIFYDHRTERYLLSLREVQEELREAEAELERLREENRRLRGQ